MEICEFMLPIFNSLVLNWWSCLMYTWVQRSLLRMCLSMLISWHCYDTSDDNDDSCGSFLLKNGFLLHSLYNIVCYCSCNGRTLESQSEHDKVSESHYEIFLSTLLMVFASCNISVSMNSFKSEVTYIPSIMVTNRSTVLFRINKVPYFIFV